MNVSATDNQLTLFEIQQMWAVLSPDEQSEAFALLDRDSAQEFFLSLSQKERATLLFRIPEGERRLWIRLLPPDDAADVIQAAPKEMWQKLMDLLDDNTRCDVRALLSYKKDVAGGLMNPRFTQVRPDQTINEALTYLRLQAQDRANSILYVFVLDEEQHLLGVVSLHDLFAATPDKKVSEVMKTEVVTVTEDQDREVVGKLFTQYKFLALPVVDSERKIKGIITADDILHTVEAEATEDIHKLGGMEALDQPYLKVSFFSMMKKRAVWLAALFLGEMMTASAMGHYHEEMAQAVILVLFLPLIISSGGNSGSQASTLVIRAMALGEVKLRDWWRIVYREVGMGLGLGLILATIGVIRILIWQSLFHMYGEHYMLVAAAVGVSLVGVVMWGTTAGSMLPFILRKLGFDPASASAPFVATLVDVSGIIIYFTAAAIILRGTLL